MVGAETAGAVVSATTTVAAAAAESRVKWNSSTFVQYIYVLNLAAISANCKVKSI